MKKNPHKILVTGSNGFVGSELCQGLRATDYACTGSIRDSKKAITGQEHVVVETLDSSTDWRAALAGCDTVIHLAGRAHVLTENVSDPSSIFREINTLGTLNLAEQAAELGISRFIFLSSIAVNGAFTSGLPFTPNDPPFPHSPYAMSKLEAEIGLRKLSKRSNLEVVIIRAPAVYGKNAPGNFRLLAQFIRYGIPLPVGSICNRRSLVSIKNLVSFIVLCIEHQKVENKLFIVSDNEDLSTVEVVKLMGKFVGKKPRIIKFSLILLRFIFKCLGKQKVGQSLMEDLQVDSDLCEELLGWSPPFSPKAFIKSLD